VGALREGRTIASALKSCLSLAKAPHTPPTATMADPVNEAEEDLLDYEDEEEAPAGAQPMPRSQTPSRHPADKSHDAGGGERSRLRQCPKATPQARGGSCDVNAVARSDVGCRITRAR
jgi:hypothetical protein